MKARVEPRPMGIEMEFPVIAVSDEKRCHTITSFPQLFHSPIEGVNSQFHDPRSGNNKNSFLDNGSHPYDDQQLFEYASPECLGIDELAEQSVAASYFVHDALVRNLPEFRKERSGNLARLPLAVHARVASDGSKSSIGMHESYSVNLPEGEKAQKARQSLVRHLSGMYIGRTIFNGAGMAVKDRETGRPLVQPAQKMRLIQEEIKDGVGTKVPLMIYRNENHNGDSPDTIRAQAVAGDYNISEFATRATIGVAAVSIRAWEHGLARDLVIPDVKEASYQAATDSQALIKAEHRGRLKNFHPIDLLEYYLEIGYDLKERGLLSPDEALWIPDWIEASDDFRRDQMLLEDRFDWIKKQSLQDRRHDRRGPLSAAQITEGDLAFDSLIAIDPRKRAGWRIRERGDFRGHIPRERINRILRNPPDTRAKHRSDLIEAMRRVPEGESVKKQIGWDYALLTIGNEEYVVVMSDAAGNLTDAEKEQKERLIQATYSYAA